MYKNNIKRLYFFGGQKSCNKRTETIRMFESNLKHKKPPVTPKRGLWDYVPALLYSQGSCVPWLPLVACDVPYPACVGLVPFFTTEPNLT